jgi:uncharacterized protein with ParB-like and HNH nuclease domain
MGQKILVVLVYQRAYAWGEREGKTFIDDLKEQIQGNSSYFFGNILLEIIQYNRIFETVTFFYKVFNLSVSGKIKPVVWP